ncbi:hypothetical protein [Candidatus Rariloculus sp.]|uniref:hypothetical protein n=1 Tax=Candidatus Rariloculus sp. TaxID=3101265 RepID=UPI003D0FD9E2
MVKGGRPEGTAGGQAAMAGGVAPAPEAQSWRSALGAIITLTMSITFDNRTPIKLIAKPPGPRVNATGALNAPLLARSLSCSVNIK